MNQPIQKYTAGSIHAAIWKNEINVPAGTKTLLKVTVERRFKDKEGNWKSTQSLGKHDIPVARHVMQQAFAYMLEHNGDTHGEE